MRTIIATILLTALLLLPGSAGAMRAVEEGTATESTSSSTASGQTGMNTPKAPQGKGTLTIRTAPEGRTTQAPPPAGKPAAPQE